MFYLPLLICISICVSGQRYAERNVIPADIYSSPDSVSNDYDYDYDSELYGFEDEDADVYKWNVEKFPHPVNEHRFCNRLKPSHVCDPDRVLEKYQADMLDSSIQRLYRETPCICKTCNDGDGGIVVGIAILKHMFHPYNVHHYKVIKSFAETLRFRWKLGECDNDILIVVATADRLSYTDVGQATSHYLSISEAHRIFLENKSKFSAFNFSEGLMDILEGYRRATEGMKERIKRDNDDLNLPMIAGAIVGSILILGILLFGGFVFYKLWKNNKQEDEDEDKKDAAPDRGSTKSSSWTKKDIKLLFGPEKTETKYQKCGTDEIDANKVDEDEEVTMDLSLATPSDTSFQNQTQTTEVTNNSEILERDLETAAEGIASTFPSKSKMLMTDC